jgi:hypothetical protein
MQHASIYKRKDGWYLNSDSQSNGALIAGPSFLKLPLDATCESLGNGIKTVINASLADVPFPTDWGPVFRPALDLAGVKSWSEFARNAQCVGVKGTESAIVILPWRKDRGSFFPLPDLEFQLSANASPEEVGKAVQRGIELCK